MVHGAKRRVISQKLSQPIHSISMRTASEIWALVESFATAWNSFRDPFHRINFVITHYVGGVAHGEINSNERASATWTAMKLRTPTSHTHIDLIIIK